MTEQEEEQALIQATMFIQALHNMIVNNDTRCEYTDYGLKAKTVILYDFTDGDLIES